MVIIQVMVMNTNVLIALGKGYIWNCRLNSLKLSLPLFHCQINRNLSIKRQIPEVNELLVNILDTIFAKYC